MLISKKLILLAICLVFVAAACNKNQTDSPAGSNSKTEAKIDTKVSWEIDMDQKKWEPSRTPPPCPDVEFISPVDLSKVTSVLYPGQYRGEDGGYRVHGGFRFDKQPDTKIDVRAPFDAYVYRGSRYLVGGKLQYVFDFVHPCGIMYRLGHLYVVEPKLQELAEKFPQPKEGDSRDHMTKRVVVEKGELLATEVGVPGNVFVDWGVYDLRQENEASKNSTYRNQHGWFSYLSFHGLCWLDYLPADEEKIVKSLPGGDLKKGKQSDYCK